MGKFESLWVHRKLQTTHGRWNRAGQVGGGGMGWGGRPLEIWEPLLRFIGVGILQTWGIIHGKASLSAPVYTMRQGWQRWRPSTAGPSCLNIGLSHLTYPWHQLQPFGISQKNTRASKGLTKHCATPSSTVSFYHRTSSTFPVSCCRCMHIFSCANITETHYFFFFRFVKVWPSAFPLEIS